jgi:hypothetical protein
MTLTLIVDLLRCLCCKQQSIMTTQSGTRDCSGEFTLTDRSMNDRRRKENGLGIMLSRLISQLARSRSLGTHGLRALSLSVLLRPCFTLFSLSFPPLLHSASARHAPPLSSASFSLLPPPSLLVLPPPCPLLYWTACLDSEPCTTEAPLCLSSTGPSLPPPSFSRFSCSRRRKSQAHKKKLCMSKQKEATAMRKISSFITVVRLWAVSHT